VTDPLPVAAADRWVLISLVENQIDALAAREKLSSEETKVKLLGEKQPSLEFTTPEQLGAFAAFLCSDAAAQLNGAAAGGRWLDCTMT
jgi:3-hydroxybutyrate dehydrogenase